MTLPYVGEHFPPDRGAYACWNRLYIIEQSMASSQSTPIHKRKNKKKRVCTAANDSSWFMWQWRWGSPRELAETQRVCMCGASSWWTFELLFSKYVYIYSHMHVCACIWMAAAALYGLTNSRGHFFLLQHRTLLPRPLKPLRGVRVAEGINSLLSICSFSQQQKSLQILGLQMPSTDSSNKEEIKLGTC